ncbi:MAG: anaerobic ribonucleoside-triphosphate reductase activating protein [Ruminococcaceae bacterium]|nr:anaerobic ribonucleoside-triphosphate reductase activating protein [Oscillospiraceae bacterium]
MKICGLMKLTLLDFPGKVGCTVFLGGCNLRCQFCHNAELAFESCGDEISEEEFFKFLEKRKGMLDGVCVSGGEPLLNDGIISFLKKIKEKDYAVKLDTNGCFPERLKEVLEAGVCDYVAMDVKNSLGEYAKTVGVEDFDTNGIEKSIELLKTSGIDHEFRTTVVKGLHTEESIEKLSLLLKGEKKYFLQAFIQSDRVLDGSLEEYTKDELENLLKIAQRNVPDAVLRGI